MDLARYIDLCEGSVALAARAKIHAAKIGANQEDGMAINERGEIMAELFYAATGFIAPGKSAPPALQTEQYVVAWQTAWAEWNDTKALNMAIKFIQALRHNEAEHDRLYDALINSDTNQLRQERDALRLRIKAVDEEHIQLAEDRKKMIDAYTNVEEQKNFWEREHEALMETCRTMQGRLDKKDDDSAEKMKRGANNMDLGKYSDLCEEQCGFSRDSQNPDSRGWRDILEWICEDPGCKAALVARFKARLEEDEEEAEVLESDDDRYPACWEDLKQIARAGAGLQFLNKKGGG